MKIFYFVLICLVCSNNLQAQWVSQNINTFNTIHQIECLDSFHCFCAGDNGTIKKTVDGNSWVDANSGVSNATYISDLKCFDNNNCYGVGGNSFITTSDAGLTWQETNLGFYAAEMCFPSPLIGFIISPFEGNIYKTSDGGNTWTPLTNIPPNIEIFRNLFFLDVNTGILSARENLTGDVELYKTIDGGLSWSKIYDVPGSIYSPHIIDGVFLSSDIIYACGSAGRIIKSIDGGSNWTELTNPYQFDNSVSYFSLDFINSTTGYVSGSSGRIMKTNDGGQTWAEENPSTLMEFNVEDIDIASLETVYLVHLGVFKNDNANLSAYIQENGDSNFTLIYPNPNNGEFAIQSVDECEFVLLNELGKTVKLIKLSFENNFTSTIENLNAGVYFLSGLNVKNGIVQHKVIVTK